MVKPWKAPLVDHPNHDHGSKPKRAKPSRPVLVALPTIANVSQTDLFFRRYRAALLDYLVSRGESRLAYAYEFGRARIDENIGLLQIVRVHLRAVKSILESTPPRQRLARVIDSEQFLMEALSTFEMASRGYVAMVHNDRRHEDVATPDPFNESQTEIPS